MGGAIDYSSNLEYDLSYNDDKTIAELKIKLNTEDDVYLDFNNSDELTNNIEEGNYSLSVQEDKVYSFSIAKMVIITLKPLY